jgi:cell division protein FtsB
MKDFPIRKSTIFLIAGIFVLFYLVLDLNGRLQDMTRLTGDRDTAATEVAELEATVYSLNTQVAYATSDVAVEEWARQQGRLTRPGDVLIVPLPAEGEVTPQVQITPTVTPEPVQNWEIWRELFFKE